MPRTQATVTTRDGQAPVHIFTPEPGSAGHSGAQSWPAVLVYMDGRGIRPALFELADRIAQSGYYVLLPDLFYRAGAYEAPDPRVFSEDPAARKRWFERYISTANHANVRSDTEAYLAFLARQPQVRGERIGTTGYCLGGGLSLSAAGHFPERVAAAASYHGGNLATDAKDSPHLLADKIRGRVYVAGAIEDASFDDAQKARLLGALQAARVEAVVETYDGAKHGWVPSDSAVHHPEAAERHYRTLIQLLDATLKAPDSAKH